VVSLLAAVVTSGPIMPRSDTGFPLLSATRAKGDSPNRSSGGCFWVWNGFVRSRHRGATSPRQLTEMRLHLDDEALLLPYVVSRLPMGWLGHGQGLMDSDIGSAASVSLLSLCSSRGAQPQTCSLGC
jgi:hypothetical protein